MPFSIINWIAESDGKYHLIILWRLLHIDSLAYSNTQKGNQPDWNLLLLKMVQWEKQDYLSLQCQATYNQTNAHNTQLNLVTGTLVSFQKWTNKLLVD